MRGKFSATMLSACGTLFFSISASPAVRAQTRSETSRTASRPVVVELFTSEGCSDCPPADGLLRRLEQHSFPGIEIIPLEEHVDYWNHDGWIDPYSSVEWTIRQRMYIAKTRSAVPYTPEMVVDGEAQFVGSNARKAQIAIERAETEPRTDILIAPGRPESKNSQRFTVTVGKLAGAQAGDRADVWLAVTEDGLQSSVTAGENRGRLLSHAAVLRSLRRIGTADLSEDPQSFTNYPKVRFNSDWKRENLRVVVFVQERKSLRILGAASAQIAE